MAITVEELPGYLRRLGDRAKHEAPIRAVVAMGQAYQGEVVRSMHGPAPSPPGTPPARRSGTLARSVRVGAARMVRAYAAQNSVSPHTAYARIQQAGGDIQPRHLTSSGHLGFLRWEDASGVHFSRHVRLPARPYMVMTPQARSAVHHAAVRAVDGMLP